MRAGFLGSSGDGSVRADHSTSAPYPTTQVAAKGLDPTVQYRSDDGVLSIGGAGGIIVGCTDASSYIDPRAVNPEAGSYEWPQAKAAAAKSPPAAAGSRDSPPGAQTGAPAVDELAPAHLRAGRIVDGRDARLITTAIGASNLKFYLIQLVAVADADDEGGADKYYVFYRWGRVGEAGQSLIRGPLDQLAAAEREFDNKFRDKTKNTWEATRRGEFEPQPGKYELHAGGIP